MAYKQNRFVLVRTIRHPGSHKVQWKQVEKDIPTKQALQKTDASGTLLPDTRTFCRTNRNMVL